MNVRKYLLKTLSNSKLLNLLGDKKVYFLHATSPKPPYIEYEVLDERGEEYSEGKEDYTSYLIQVDIFNNGNYGEIEKILKKLMNEAGFSRTGGADLYEDKTKLYHKALRFSISLPSED